jgi:hypothetical protein
MTEFVDGDGHVCGSHPISFLAQPQAGRPVQMDAQEADGVVQAMAGCVGRR